jgi:hypothetical protein
MEHMVPLSYTRRAMSIYEGVDKEVRASCFHRGRSPKHWLYSVLTHGTYKTLRSYSTSSSKHRHILLVHSSYSNTGSTNGHIVILVAYVGLYIAVLDSCKSFSVDTYNNIVT